jgi:hypothetical protein
VIRSVCAASWPPCTIAECPTDVQFSLYRGPGANHAQQFSVGTPWEQSGVDVRQLESRSAESWPDTPGRADLEDWIYQENPEIEAEDTVPSRQAPISPEPVGRDVQHHSATVRDPFDDVDS